MGIYIVRYEDQGETKWGVLRDQQVIPVVGDYQSLASFLREGVAHAKRQLEEAEHGLLLDEVRLLSPITQPARIVCQGANYAKHRAEAGLKPERAPFNLIFTKADSSLSGPQDNIVCPPHVQLLDYEIEVGLVIGKEISGPVEVTEANLHEYVAGIVITNDVSSRDVQFTEGQWYKGKSYRTFCPTGPYVYLFDQDEASIIHNLEVNLWVNGELRQSANTEQMLFKPEESLTELSQLMDFSPGDLVLTGTPGGVALHLNSETLDQLMNPFVSFDKKMGLLVESQQDNPRYLKEGDVIRCEVKTADGRVNLGCQENRVVRVTQASLVQ